MSDFAIFDGQQRLAEDSATETLIHPLRSGILDGDLADRVMVLPGYGRLYIIPGEARVQKPQITCPPALRSEE